MPPTKHTWDAPVLSPSGHASENPQDDAYVHVAGGATGQYALAGHVGGDGSVQLCAAALGAKPSSSRRQAPAAKRVERRLELNC